MRSSRRRAELGARLNGRPTSQLTNFAPARHLPTKQVRVIARARKLCCRRTSTSTRPKASSATGKAAAGRFVPPRAHTRRPADVGDTARPEVKLKKVSGVTLAILDQTDTGPRLGADGHLVPLQPSRAAREKAESERVAMSKLWSYYERMPDGGNCLFADGEAEKGTLLTSLRAHAGVYEEGEEILLDEPTDQPNDQLCDRPPSPDQASALVADPASSCLRWPRAASAARRRNRRAVRLQVCPISKAWQSGCRRAALKQRRL